MFTEEFSTHNTANDGISDVSTINATCTVYSAERIVIQLRLSRSVMYTVLSGDRDGVFKAVYKSWEHCVSLIANNCSCGFSKVMGLPCQHNFIFVVRASQNLPVFEVQLVARRWHKAFQLLMDPSEVSDDRDEEDNSGALQVSSLTTNFPLKSTLSKNQKYKKALGLGQKLAALSSECGMAEFRRKIVVLESLLSYWERKCDIEIVPVQEDEAVVLVSKCFICITYLFIPLIPQENAVPQESENILIPQETESTAIPQEDESTSMPEIFSQEAENTLMPQKLRVGLFFRMLRTP